MVMQSTMYCNYDGQAFTHQMFDLLKALSERERYVVTRRFAIECKNKQTLDAIGKHFSVTRERIRQIENTALKKLQRIANETKMSYVSNHAHKILNEAGGVISERRIIAKMLNLFQDPTKVDSSIVRLALSTDATLAGVRNSLEFHPYWHLASIKRSVVKEISTVAIKFLKKEKDVVLYDAMIAHVKKEVNYKKYDVDAETFGLMIMSVLEINKRIKMLEEHVGLKEWRHIHPRTLRDKIFYVLREHRNPKHFVELSNEISNKSFDNKTINTQAVHNELIRCNDFVLIGRGIYALKEWGYSHGTIADIIEDILGKSGAMKRSQIIDEVLKRRQVKKISILVTLKNKPQFARTGRDVYELVKK